jgi:RimJ/RimL family protein N-acetyltransferase
MDFWQGERVRLRGVEPEDWEVFCAWNRDTEAARLSYWIPFPQSAEAVKKWAREESLRRGEDDVYTLVIESAAGEVAGVINTHSVERRERTFKYGLAVREEHRRKGYAREAVLLVLRYYFEELGYQKATVEVYDFNTASIALHEGLGFAREGCIRRMIFTGGAYHDSLVFGMTAEEFKERYGGR